MSSTGVLLVAFGAPANLAELPAFVQGISPAAPESAMDDAVRRLLTVGGTLPLAQTAETLAAALERRLNGLPEAEEPDRGLLGVMALGVDRSTRASEGVDTPVAVGMLHGAPSIGESISEMAAKGVERVLVLSLSDPDTPANVRAYSEAASAAAKSHSGMSIELLSEDRWPEPLVQVVVDGCATAIDEQPKENRSLVLFVARGVAETDPDLEAYRRRLEGLAESLAHRAGLPTADPTGRGPLRDREVFGGGPALVTWALSYLRQESGPADLAGPAPQDLVESAAVDYQATIAVPLGFAADEEATLYDIDVLLAEQVFEAGMAFGRVPVAGTSSDAVAALEQRVRSVL